MGDRVPLFLYVMKFTIKCEKMSVTLMGGSPKDLRISVHKGRQYTNALADEIDKHDRYSVHGTAFGSGTASIHFSANGYVNWVHLAIQVTNSINRAIGDPEMEIEIQDMYPGKG